MIFFIKKRRKIFDKFVIYCICDWHAAHEMKRQQIIIKWETISFVVFNARICMFHTLINYKSNYEVTTKYDIQKSCLLKFLLEVKQ